MTQRDMTPEESAAFDRAVHVGEAVLREANQFGLRKRRERIATAVLTGFAGSTGGDPDEIARIAVIWADALIAELDKP